MDALRVRPHRVLLALELRERAGRADRAVRGERLAELRHERARALRAIALLQRDVLLAARVEQVARIDGGRERRALLPLGDAARVPLRADRRDLGVRDDREERAVAYHRDDPRLLP